MSWGLSKNTWAGTFPWLSWKNSGASPSGSALENVSVFCTPNTEVKYPPLDWTLGVIRWNSCVFFFFFMFPLWQCNAHDVLQFTHKHHLVRVWKRCCVSPDSVVTNTAWNCHKVSLKLPRQQSLTWQSVAYNVDRYERQPMYNTSQKCWYVTYECMNVFRRLCGERLNLRN